MTGATHCSCHRIRIVFIRIRVFVFDSYSWRENRACSAYCTQATVNRPVRGIIPSFPGFPAIQKTPIFRPKPRSSGECRDGFIVGRAIAGTPLAILGVGLNSNATTFAPCHGTRTMVFVVPPGTVLYFGNVLYSFPLTPTRNSQVSTSYSDDIAAARDYLKSRYPKLADKLEHGNVQLLPTDEPCLVIY